jgi:hypothetical protein
LHAHAGLLERARAFAQSVGDNPDTLKEVYFVNLLTEVMPEEVRLRAMRALLPALLIDADRLRRSCVKEAEALWGRKLSDFPSFPAFAQAFERAAREVG